MKKLFVLAIAMVASNAALAFTHDVISQNRGDRGQVTAVHGGFGGDLAGSLTFYADSYVTFSFTSEKPSIPGWNADNITFSMYQVDQATGTSYNWTNAGAASTGTLVTLDQILKYKDAVGFAISDGKKTIYSTPGVDDSGESQVAFRLDGDLLYIGFYVNGNSQHSIDKADIVYTISVNSSGIANGQPLPGVLATLALGAGVLLRRRRA